MARYRKLFLKLSIFILSFLSININVKAASKEYVLPFNEPNIDYLFVDGIFYIFYAQPYGEYINLDSSSAGIYGHSSSTYYHLSIDSDGSLHLRSNYSSTLDRYIYLHYGYWNGSKWNYKVTSSTTDTTIKTGITTSSYIYASCPIASSITFNNANLKFNSQPDSQIDYNNTLNSISSSINTINTNINNLNDTTESLKTTIKAWLVGGNSTSSLATVIRNQFTDLNSSLEGYNENLISSIESALTQLGLDLEKNANDNRKLINDNIDEFNSDFNTKLDNFMSKFDSKMLDLKTSLINQLVTLQNTLHQDINDLDNDMINQTNKIDDDLINQFEIADYYIKNQSYHLFNISNNSNVIDIKHKFNVEAGSLGLRFYPTFTNQQKSNNRTVYLSLITSKNIINTTIDVNINVLYANSSSRSITGKLKYNSIGNCSCIFDDNTDDIIRYVNIILDNDDFVTSSNNEYITSCITFIYPGIDYNDSQSNYSVNKNENINEQLSEKSMQYESTEKQFQNKTNQALANVNVSNNPVLLNNDFLVTSVWVKNQINELMKREQLTYIPIYVMILGLSLFIIGKAVNK